MNHCLISFSLLVACATTHEPEVDSSVTPLDGGQDAGATIADSGVDSTMRDSTVAADGGEMIIACPSRPPTFRMSRGEYVTFTPESDAPFPRSFDCGTATSSAYLLARVEADTSFPLGVGVQREDGRTLDAYLAVVWHDCLEGTMVGCFEPVVDDVLLAGTDISPDGPAFILLISESTLPSELIVSLFDNL